MKETMTPAEVIALKKEIFSSLHCAMPGIVESFDADSVTAVIRPAVKNTAGTALPFLYDVPVFMPVLFDVNPGDACLVVCADCDIDAWFETGECAIPASDRKHSLSDAFAFVGFRTAGHREES
ncbi:hypothetical protein JS518_14280 [Clostridiales bacterium FE2010]|nr:hypothetical protein JS518_14280 [Clostridiales bacterium FE2010]